MDIGIYPVIDALTFMGVPEGIKAAAVFGQTGSEESILAECNAARLLPTITVPVPGLPKDIQVSAVITDPQTGEVLAMMGESTLDRETAMSNGHTPGTLLTPFVALAAFARGYTPADLVWDIPETLPEALKNELNPDGAFHGPIRLRMALANDYLAPIAQILEQINPNNLWRILEPLGITGVDRSNIGSAILYNGGLFTPLEAAQAYGVLAAEGNNNGISSATSSTPSPRFVIAVTDARGSAVDFDDRTATQTVLSSQLAFLLNDVLRDETARWQSLGNPNALEIGRPAGGKIGQVSGKQQLWSAGYTPQRVVIIWMG
ncbi:MAG: hypothetical protein HGA28_06485 [Anaerolineaceae bacterium]|nr:hypothetical protein [Anaerolineaceae bacterium]